MKSSSVSCMLSFNYKTRALNHTCYGLWTLPCDSIHTSNEVLKWSMTLLFLNKLILVVIVQPQRNRLLVRAPDLWSKGCKFESQQRRRENFLLWSQLCLLTLMWCPFHPRVTVVAHKRPRSFCQNCRWQVTHKHAYTLDPSRSEWTDYAAIQAECGNLSEKQLTRNLSGNVWSQSSQFAEPLWTDPGLKRGISMRKLISTLKKSAGGEWIFEHSPKIIAHKEKATTTTSF